MLANDPEIKTHHENFSLADFFSSEGATLLERVKNFSDYYRESLDLGLALYGRELVSSPGPRVLVQDSQSKNVKSMIMLGSNDYLGLTHHPLVIQKVCDVVRSRGVGMGGPPLLNGTSSLHRQLETQVAQFKGDEDALIFASGFQANLGWITALLRSDDVLIYDELNHASLYDGIKIAKATARFKTMRFNHNDTDHLDALLEKARNEKKPMGQIFVAVEGVYSMDGDLAPLDIISELCKKYEANLIVDDAHGTGVLGETGSGTAEYFGVKADISMGSFSKTFGVTGGFLVASQPIIDYLRFFSRSYMFSAHLSQSTVAAVLGGLAVLKANPQLVKQVRSNAVKLTQKLKVLGFDASSESAIIPIRIPQHIDIRILNRRFHEEGLFVNSIEYPAVPIVEQRIRLSVMATHTDEDIDAAAEIFKKLGQEFKLI